MQSYFRSLYSQVEALSEDLMVVDAMKEFRRAYKELEARSIPESWRQSIDEFYRQSFLPQLPERDEGSPIADLYEPHDSAGEYLQYHYIASNLNTVGGKQQLLDAGDGSQYSRMHARYHCLTSCCSLALRRLRLHRCISAAIPLPMWRAGSPAFPSCSGTWRKRF